MKQQLNILTVLLAACGMQASAQGPTPIAPAPVLPATTAKPAATTYTITTSKDWQNPAALRDSLAKKIQARLKNNEESAIKSFLKSEYNRLLLANWYLAHAEIASEKAYADYAANLEKQLNDRKKKLAEREAELPLLGGESAQESARYFINKLKGEIAELEAELKQPMRLADVVKRPRASRLIELMANDLGWLGDVVYSGECIMPGRMLNMLANMMERYTKMLPNERVPRDIATATAIEYARFGWTVNNACERAEYFVRNWRQNRLHPQFDTLPFLLRRVTCGWKGDHSSGKPERLEWALKYVHLTDERYTGCCWRCGYVLHNVYGDSIHGSPYFEPFEGMYLNNHHKFTQEVGGVCGGLSHFGASAACANGVPGLTMGEPAHCAYVVWVDGKWTPAYSVDWQRGLHWRPWMDNYNYSSLHLTTDLYSPEQKSATRLSNAYRALAQMATDRQQAHQLYLKAEAAQPLNYPVYREHSAFLKERMKLDTAAWMELNNSICTNLVPVYPECASTLVRNFVYDNLAQSAAKPEEQEAAFACFWQNIKERGPERWKLQELADKQIDMLNKVRKNAATDNICTVFRSMMNNTITKKDYSSYVLECGNNMLKKLDEAGKGRILTIMTEAISSGEGMSPEERAKALANAVLTTESMRDAGAFQAVSKLIAPALAHDNRPIGEFEAFPGKLVSEGGVIFASSTSRWDKPATHANVLTRQGGQIHTNRDKNPWVAVKLPKHATISGVVIVAHSNGANWHRLNNLQIQVSETGKDDDWHNAGQLTGPCKQRITRVDLQAEQPKALYVRVIRPDTQEVFHMDGLFVYGTPAA
ncbi:MAG: hypothetical protein J6R92_00225 [Akkermansia sp.]|nr:hypothetical protein [Akkermansia sp.]